MSDSDGKPKPKPIASNKGIEISVVCTYPYVVRIAENGRALQ